MVTVYLVSFSVFHLTLSRRALTLSRRALSSAYAIPLGYGYTCIFEPLLFAFLQLASYTVI